MNNKPIKLVLLLFIAVLSAVLCSAKPESQWNPPDEMVYGGNWPEPNEVNVPPEELAFHHSESRNFENESIFFSSS